MFVDCLLPTAKSRLFGLFVICSDPSQPEGAGFVGVMLSVTWGSWQRIRLLNVELKW